MESEITQDEHQAIVDAERTGRLLIGVDTQIARRFFTDTDHSTIQDAIGEPLYLERFIIQSSMWLEFLLIGVSCVLCVWALGWWALIAIPVYLLGWLSVFFGASLASRKIWPMVVVAFAAACLPIVTQTSRPFWLWLITVTLSLFFAQFTYTGATIFLRNLVLRNRRALGLLQNQGVVLREVYDMER